MRIDSEFYEASHIRLERILQTKSYQALTTVARVADGNHFKISDDFLVEGIPYYRGQDTTGNFFIEQSDPVCIDFETFNQGFMHRSHLKKGDVLVSIVGTIGNVSLVTTNKQATCSCKLAILRPYSMSSEYLTVFLKTKFGQSQIKKFARGAVQTGFVLVDASQIKIATPSLGFQEQIGELLTQAHDLQRQSGQLYQDAEKLLLAELGLSDWKPKTNSFELAGVKMAVEETASVVSLGSVETFFRLDSEHWQPNLLAVEEQIKAYGFTPLGNHAKSVNRGIQPLFVDEGDVFVIASKAVRPARIRVDSNECTNQAFYSKPNVARARINKGDVLLNGTGVGTLGRAGIYDRDEPAVADNHVTIIRLRDSLNPYFLMLFLNALPGQVQSERWQTGSSGQLELYPNQIERFLIPNVPAELQDQIAGMIQESYRTKDASQHLLSLAKQAVELYIEEDEATAMALIESQYLGD